MKKNFSSNTPRGVARYLFEVTRLTVDLCMPMASATVFTGSAALRCSTPWTRKAILLACTILAGDLQDGAGAEALIQAFLTGSQLAWAKHSETKVFSESLRAPLETVA